MFETAEIGQKVGKKEFKARLPALREALLMAQVQIREAGIPVLILFAGVDGAGKGGVTNKLNEWLDPRYVTTRAFDEPGQSELERPHHWRFWRQLPPRGQLGIFLSGWYSQPFLRHVHGERTRVEFEEELSEIHALERLLVDDGMLILKFWMHLGKKAQKKRLEALERDPLQSWRVKEQDWKHWRIYERFVDAAETVIMTTSRGYAPWHIVEGSDENFRSLRVGELLLDAIQRRLEADARAKEAAAAEPELIDLSPAAEDPAASGPLKRRTILSTLDLKRTLAKADYKQQLATLQGQLNLLHRQLRERGIPTMLVFEGWDAAGKGGAIRRIVSALDARSVQVIPVAAPNDEERARHYLWRFWRSVPRDGRVAIFDRSWYGRVLVERVEGFATAAEWRRAYGEINHFERQLTSGGMLLLKFWVSISPDEQLRRFEEREQVPYKRWKLTEEDWRNRERWGDYELAVHDMIERTSNRSSPWVLVEGEDKRFARIKILRTVCDRMSEALALRAGEPAR